jgi:hypothetical protein
LTAPPCSWSHRRALASAGVPAAATRRWLHAPERACFGATTVLLTPGSRAKGGRPSGTPRSHVPPHSYLCHKHGSRGVGAPGRPSARHSLATRSPSSVLQNGCSSASLIRLLRALGRKHGCCELVAASFARKMRCAPADCRQQESFCQGLGPATAVFGEVDRARLQDLQRPGSTRCWMRVETPSAAAPAPTGKPQAPLHAPLRGAGPGVELSARLLRQHWTCARPLQRCGVRC